MNRTIYKARLNSIKSLTPSMRELELEILEPATFQFISGQFLMLHIPDQPKAALRAYSIASDHAQPNQAKLLIKLLNEGKASNFVKKLKGGETLELTGPFGRCVLQQPVKKNTFFICTGAGLSQHVSFLRSHTEELKDSKVRLLLGVWNENEIYYENELEELKKLYPDFQFDFVLDSPIKPWQGKTGFVTDYFKELKVMAPDTTIYLCGNPNMVQSAKKMLLEDLQFPKENLFVEAFN